MIRQDKGLRIAWALLIVNLAVIWGSSLLPGAVSHSISGAVHAPIENLLPGGSADPEWGHILLRKMGHFTEFACLGGILGWIMSRKNKPVWISLVLGVLAGCVDETIQIFVPERGPAVTDVLIDASGVLFGIFLLQAALWLRRKKII